MKVIYRSFILITMIFSFCVLAQNDDQAVEQIDFVRLEQQHPNFIHGLRQAITNTHFCCSACQGGMDVSFLLEGAAREEKRLLRCSMCRKQFHAECLAQGRCQFCQFLIPVPNDEAIINGQQEERKQHYLQCAEATDNRLGYQRAETWAQAYAQEDEAAKQLFKRLFSARISVLGDPLGGTPNVAEVIEQVDENVAGDSCIICLANTVVSRIARCDEVIGCRRCHVQLHRKCANRLNQEWGNNGNGRGCYGQRCPQCRLVNFRKEIPCLGQDGLLKWSSAPGFYENQTSFTLALRSEAYKRACRQLVLELGGRSREQQEQELHNRQAQELLRRWRQSGQARRMQEQLSLRYQHLLKKLQVASTHLIVASAAGCAIVPAGTVLYGACVGGAAVGVTCALAAKIKHYRNASRYQGE